MARHQTCSIPTSGISSVPGSVKQQLQKKQAVGAALSRITLVRKTGRLPKKFVTRHLLQHEVGNIGSGDLSRDFVGSRESSSIFPSAWAVVQHRRAHDSPIQPAFAHNSFLQLFVFEDVPQERGPNHVSKEES